MQSARHLEMLAYVVLGRNAPQSRKRSSGRMQSVSKFTFDCCDGALTGCTALLTKDASTECLQLQAIATVYVPTLQLLCPLRAKTTH